MLSAKDYAKAKTYIALNAKAGSADECAMCDLLDHLIDGKAGSVQSAVFFERQSIGPMSVAPL